MNADVYAAPYLIDRSVDPPLIALSVLRQTDNPVIKKLELGGRRVIYKEFVHQKDTAINCYAESGDVVNRLQLDET